MGFIDRTDAGRQLAERLLPLRAEAPIVLALPRGGIPVALEVARALGAPMDVWIVRKVGVPWHPELGIGAVSEAGAVYLDRQLMAQVGVQPEEAERLVRQKQAEVLARVQRFRGERPSPALEGRTVLLVDDGIATGGTIHAAVQSIRLQHPRKLVVAVPVASPRILESLRAVADEVVCVEPVRFLRAIGQCYRDFRQLSDEEAVAMLHAAAAPSELAPVGV